MNLDMSTLNAAALARLRIAAKLAPTYRISDRAGNGCAGDPPGFPSYFTRSIYTSHGNNPRRGPTEVIRYAGLDYVTQASDDWRPGDTWDAVHARYQARLLGLWIKLPIDHPRVQAWIASVHQHMRTCYIDDAGLAKAREHGRAATIIFPVPSYELRAFRDDPRFSDDWRMSDVWARAERAPHDERAAAQEAVRTYFPALTPDPSREL